MSMLARNYVNDGRDFRERIEEVCRQKCYSVRSTFQKTIDCSCAVVVHKWECCNWIHYSSKIKIKKKCYTL